MAELGTTQVGTRELGAGDVTTNVSGDATPITEGVTDRITRRRFGITGTASISTTSATTDFARIGAYVSQNLEDYFPNPLPSRGRSLLSAIIDANQTVHGHWSDDLVDVIMSHQVAQAEGEDLDRIGDFFGRIGDRGERNDDSYREYLRGVVQSFAGRGTVPGIRFAVAAGIVSDPSNVEVNEDFTNVAYDLTINEWGDHRVGSVTELAELADASGTEYMSPATYAPEGQSTKPQLGPVEYERILDLAGINATADVGPVVAEIASEGLGAGDIGDGTQIGPEQSEPGTLSVVSEGQTYLIDEGETVTASETLRIEGTLNIEGTLDHTN